MYIQIRYPPICINMCTDVINKILVFQLHPRRQLVQCVTQCWIWEIWTNKSSITCFPWWGRFVGVSIHTWRNSIQSFGFVGSQNIVLYCNIILEKLLIWVIFFGKKYYQFTYILHDLKRHQNEKTNWQNAKSILTKAACGFEPYKRAYID
jgi:hypothetical protein